MPELWELLDAEHPLAEIDEEPHPAWRYFAAGWPVASLDYARRMAAKEDKANQMMREHLRDAIGAMEHFGDAMENARQSLVELGSKLEPFTCPACGQITCHGPTCETYVPGAQV